MSSIPVILTDYPASHTQRLIFLSHISEVFMCHFTNRRMLEGDDEPTRASGDTEPELMVTETQIDNSEEEIKKPEVEEGEEKQEQEVCEAETSQSQEKEDEEEETLGKDKDEDKSQVEDKTSTEEQETDEGKADEQQKEAGPEEKEKLPQVRSDKEDIGKEKQQGDKCEDVKDISEQSTEHNLDREAEDKTEVLNKEKESPEVITKQET